jgi:hypothetical protein
MRWSLAWAAVLAAAASGAAAQNGERIAVPLSDPSRPATLEVMLLMADISVTAHDGNEIVIVTDDEIADDDDDDAPRSDGLRRIGGSRPGLTIEENDNTVSVRMDAAPRNADLAISVPRRTSVRVRTVNSGDLVVTGVTGEHELTNVNGDIVATDLSGSAVIGTTNGDVQVSFVALTPSKAMSFSSFNGDVDVTFPASLAADLHLNSGRGDVLTDFDVQVEPQSSVVEQGGNGRPYRVNVKREMRAVVGGGGPDIRLVTVNGDIMIRKRER